MLSYNLLKASAAVSLSSVEISLSISNFVQKSVSQGTKQLADQEWEGVPPQSNFFHFHAVFSQNLDK